MGYDEIYKERTVPDEWNLNSLARNTRNNIWSGLSPELYTLFWV